MKKFEVFLIVVIGLLINFRSVNAQISNSTTLHENWNVSLPTDQTCLDIQAMGGNTYELIYLGYWGYLNHYQVNKRDASGTVIATITKDAVWNRVNLTCYDSKVLLADPDASSGFLNARLYDQSLSLIRDTTLGSPWAGSNEMYFNFYFYDNYLWEIISGYDNNLPGRKIKLQKLDHDYLVTLDSLVLDSVLLESQVNPSLNFTDYRFFSKYGNYYYLNVSNQSVGSTSIGRKLKINGNLQVVDSDPPVAGDLYFDFFSYNGYLYYLNCFNFASTKLIKKDTNGFVSNWQVNIPILSNFGVAMYPHNNNFLWGPGDGNIYIIDPTDGSLIDTKSIVSLPWTFDCSYYFGKIGTNVEYPFMIVGPTFSNQTVPLRVYLLNPVTLDTLLTKVVSGVNAGYKVKENGNEVQIIGNKIVSLSVEVFPSLKIMMGSPAQEVTNGATIIDVVAPAPPTVAFNDNHDTFWVKNVSPIAQSIICKKIMLNETSGTSNYFAWGGMYGPPVIASNPLAIQPNDSSESFASYYQWAGHIGWTKIRYVFYNETNINDSVFFDLTYDILVSLPEYAPLEIKVFPNPVQNYLHIKGVIRPRIEIFNSIGEMVLVDKTENVDVRRLAPGIYFYHIYEDQAAISVKTGCLIKQP